MSTAVIPITCPMYFAGKPCGGVLNRVSVSHTDMSTYQGTDLNYITETFVCAECKRHVRRTFQWREEEIEDDTELP